MAPGLTGIGGPLQITELVHALLNAELSEVLVLSGLAFLAIAIYADVSGRIDPSRNDRIIGGVIGSVLIITGLWLFVAVPTNGPNGDDPKPTTVPETATITPTRTVHTSTPTDSPTELTFPEAADNPLASGRVYEQGQKLWLKNLEAEGGEVYQLRMVTEDGDVGRMIIEFSLDGDGEAIIDTTGLLGRYVILDQNGNPLEIDSDGRVIGPADLSIARWGLVDS